MNRWVSAKNDEMSRKTILFIDNDAYAMALRDAWAQIRLADDLRVISDSEKAVEFLENAAHTNGASGVVAIILNPDVTGENTGNFLRRVRVGGHHDVPIMLWTRDPGKYRVLEGRGVNAVLQKPMFMRLIQTLLEACRLQRQIVPGLPLNVSERPADESPQ